MVGKRVAFWCRGLLAAATLGTAAPAIAQSNDAELTVRTDRPGSTIDPDIYGQFVEHLGRGVYEGIWVGPDSPIPNTRGIRNDVAAALRKIRVPVIRWPGGCFADAYHWQDGLGPRDRRPVGINSAWNETPETNQFGIREFMDFIEQVGTKPFVWTNVGSGSVPEKRRLMVCYSTRNG
ncbi:hypothetical protein [Sphingomonas sp. Leaf10]|uniref:hypothetical protein n=1 Tax=Sphingomonas sp. Leaf10 TaxID=1735676 RepID=UPI0006FC56B9|nr:hypothetical protein [Sphingomonas sp. Leaf10]KQM30919.1 hypothetical protein ASE59_07475 [Sphingomonas sp. Leaf10]